MKQIFSIICLFILAFSFNAFSQTNLTWTIKDRIEKGSIKTLTVFNSNFSGFATANEALAFCQKIKSNPEVASCEIISKSVTSCDVRLTMKQAHDKRYYASFATRLGIANIVANGNKKTPADWAEKKTQKH